MVFLLTRGKNCSCRGKQTSRPYVALKSYSLLIDALPLIYIYQLHLEVFDDEFIIALLLRWIFVSNIIFAFI